MTMDYEKAYKEALKRARMLNNGEDVDVEADTTACEYIFPELKESEDDKIKKELIKFVKVNIPDEERYIDWLEKQGNQKSIWHYEDEEPQRGSLILLIMQSGTPIVAKIIEPNHTLNHGERWAYIDDLLETQGEKISDPRYSILDKLIEADNIYQMSVNDAMVEEAKNKAISALARLTISKLLGLEKQGKSALEAIKEEKVDNANKVEPKDYSSIDPHFFKPVDKVEPKFHVGDWIIHQGTENIYQVVARIDNQYQLKYDDNYTIQNCADVDRCARLWDITKDTKKGDVLSDGTTIFIFKDLLSDGSVMSCCDYDADSGESDAFSPFSVNLMCSKITPATKEQRDLLFSKMKEAGYEWDSEKKELKKIHNALVECEIEDIEHGKYYYCIKDYYSGGNKRASKGDVVQALRGMSMMALGVKANEYFIPVNAIKQEKSNWSDEDDKNWQGIIDEIKANKSEAPDYDIITYDRYLSWLQQLKYRIGG